MIKDYGLFNHHLDNNTLLILFSDKKVTRTENNGDLQVLYHENACIGYSIPNFDRYAKIKYSGILFLPAIPLIDVINDILRNHQLEPLEYRKESGYIVKIDESGNRCVFAKEGIFLRDETISNGHYCSYYDLYINKDNRDELIILDEDIKEGTDFFKMEAK